MPEAEDMGRTIGLLTLGCAKNETDSAKMAGLLSESGFRVRKVEDVSPSSLEGLDALVINTCSFIQEATEAGIDCILGAIDSKADVEDLQLIVTGCMPSRYGDDLAKSIPEVDAFLGCSSEGDIVEVAKRALGIDGSSTFMVAPSDWDSYRPYAYLKISEGCSRHCSYCTIPSIRGPYRNLPQEDLVKEVSKLVEDGKREIVLVAQDSGIWGKDLPGECSLASLLDTLAATFPRTWFRALYIQPEGITDELLDVMAAHDNICPYLDIPIQHVNPRILGLMNRSNSIRNFVDLASQIKGKLPDATLRTTLIAGFPTETDEEFEELLGFVESGTFDYVGVFPYSPEEGTPAASMDGQIPEDERISRASELRNAADSVAEASSRSRIGSTYKVLVEGVDEDGNVYGRTMGQAPEVDGVTFVDRGKAGDVLDVTIEDTLLYDMEGSVALDAEGPDARTLQEVAF